MLTIRTVVAGSAIVMARCVARRLLHPGWQQGAGDRLRTRPARRRRTHRGRTSTWQLEIARPDAARTLDSLRIAVRPTPDELQVYKGASWAKRPSEQIEDMVLRTLEDSQKITAVAPNGSGMTADYTLLMELRRYEADYAGNSVPAATIEINAKLLHARTRRSSHRARSCRRFPRAAPTPHPSRRPSARRWERSRMMSPDGRWRPATQIRARRRRRRISEPRRRGSGRDPPEREVDARAHAARSRGQRMPMVRLRLAGHQQQAAMSPAAIRVSTMARSDA